MTFRQNPKINFKVMPLSQKSKASLGTVASCGIPGLDPWPGIDSMTATVTLVAVTSFQCNFFLSSAFQGMNLFHAAKTVGSVPTQGTNWIQPGAVCQTRVRFLMIF